MPERVISTRMVLDGEKEYKASVANINRELRLLDSQMKLVDSQFQGQANSVAALEAKQKVLTDTIAKQAEKLNAEKTAQQQLQDLQRKAAQQAEAVRKKLEDLAKTTDDADKEGAEYKDQVSKLEAELRGLESAEARAAAGVLDHTRKSNDAQVKLNGLNGELEKNEQYLNEARASADGCATSIDAFGNEAKDAGEKAEDLGDKGKAGVDALASALAAAGVAAAIKEIADQLMACLDASIGFESALAGVAKTTDLTDAELTAMGDALKEMSTRIPLTASELAQIAESAGQLGIEKENLLGFTEVMAMLGTSTNMTSTEAAEMLAQFANVTGLDPGKYSNLGSAIVALGNSSATTEKKITEMAQGIAGAGENVGMTEPDMLALSAAVTSLGIEAGTGGTNMASFIGKMQMAVETGQGLDDWAATAGMSAKDFSALWGTDATGAILAFMTGLNDLDDSANVTLQTLGLSDQRMVRMITSLANAEQKNGLLSKSISTANQAWKDNNALQKEAATRYGTTESKIKIYKNSVDNLRIAIGDQLKPQMNGLVEAGTNVVQWATDLIETHPELVRIVTALLSAGAAFVGVATALAVVTKAWGALSTLISANPWTIAIAAVAGIGIALATLASGAKETDESLESLKETSETIKEQIAGAEQTYSQDVERINASSETALGYLERLSELEGQTSRTEAEQREYAMTLEKLQALMPDLNLEIDTQTGLLLDGAEAAREQVSAWREMQYAEAMMAYRTTLVKAQAEADVAMWEAEKKLLDNSGALAEADKKRSASLLEMLGLFGYNKDAAKSLLEANKEFTQSDWQTFFNGAEFQVSPENLGRFYELFSAVGEMGSEVVSLSGKNEELTKTYEDMSESSGDAAEQVAFLDEKLGTSAEGTAAAADSASEYSAMVDEQLAKAKELQDAYQASYDAAYENISGSIGLFEEMEIKEAASVENMMAALKSQTEYMETYARLMKEAGETGIDKGILQSISNMGPEALPYLQAFVKMSEDEIAAMNEEFKKSEASKETLATTVAAMETDFKTKMAAMESEMNAMIANLNQEANASANGSATIQGLISGLDGKKGELQSLASSINAIIATIGRTNPIAIPSVTGGTGRSHASGLEYVPSDGYLASLHEGEMVLTRLQAQAYRGERWANYGFMRDAEEIIRNVNNSATYQISINVSGSGGSGRKIGADIMGELDRQLRYRGVLRA